MPGKKFFEDRLRSMLEVSGLPVQSAYTPGQVRELLNITEWAFRQMCANWEPPGTPNRREGGLESYVLTGHRRVPFHGLVDWLAENNTFGKEMA